MVRKLELNDDLPGTSIEEFCALFQRADTFYAYHWWLHKSDRIRVGDWEGADGLTRRMSFLVPYQAPRWFKRAVGTEVVKIRDEQRLEMERDGGRLVAMTMLSRPQLYIPGNTYLPMGDVRFHVEAADHAGVPGCKLTTKLACTAEGLKWLWAMRGAIERIMIGQCKVVAETFVDFCGRACREGLEPAPFQRARHSRSISGSLGRSLSNALGRTLSRGSGLRRSSSGAARAAGTPRREEGTLTQQSGGSLGSPGRRDSAKDCSAAATERSEPRAAACGPGAHATSMEKSMDSGSTARGATAGAAGGDAASPRGQGEREAQAVHARGASLASVHAHARRSSSAGSGAGDLGGSGASVMSTVYFDASEDLLPGSPVSIGRSSPSRTGRATEAAGQGQPAGAEAWVTHAGGALRSEAPSKPQPRPRRPRVAGKAQAPGKRRWSDLGQCIPLPCTATAVQE